MAGPVRCECGAILLQDVDDNGVTLVGSAERIRFRRTTDHVVCEKCMRSYAIRDLSARESDSDIAAQLDRLIMRIERQDPGPG